LLSSLSLECQLHYIELISALAVSIDQEIKGLQLFGYALREVNRKLFEQIMSVLELEVLEKASLAKNPFEVVAMGLIFQQ
jgi:hypothetical protein